MISTRDAILGGLSMFAAGGLISAVISDNYFTKLIVSKEKNATEKATSNLVSALNIATSNSLTSLHFRARGIINDDSIEGYQKIAIAGAYIQGIGHLEDIQNIFNFHGKDLATGKVKAEELQKKIIQTYGETTPANYDYSKWKQEL